MSKKLFFIIIFCILVSGCGITGKVVNSIDSEVEAQLEKDYSRMVDAIDKEDPSLCYYVMTQDIREDCFMRLAKKTGDKSVCKNLLSSQKEECLAQLS